MNFSRVITIIISLDLLIEGIWGLSSPVVWGVLTTNRLHATIHLVLGVVGLWSARAGRWRGFLTFIGILLLAVGVLWFLPPTRDTIANILAVNRPVAWVNVVIGAISLICAGSRRERIERTDSDQAHHPRGHHA